MGWSRWAPWRDAADDDAWADDAWREGTWRDSVRGVDGFPWLVTFLCMAAALFLWFRSTAPLLRERELLEKERQALTERLVQTAAEARSYENRLVELGADVQTLLLELDRRGVHPARIRDDEPLSEDDVRRALAALGVQPIDADEEDR